MDKLIELLEKDGIIFNKDGNEITIGETIINRRPLITIEEDYIDTAEDICFSIYHANLNGRIQLFDVVEVFEDIKKLIKLK